MNWRVSEQKYYVLWWLIWYARKLPRVQWEDTVYRMDFVGEEEFTSWIRHSQTIGNVTLFKMVCNWKPVQYVLWTFLLNIFGLQLPIKLQLRGTNALMWRNITNTLYTHEYANSFKIMVWQMDGPHLMATVVNTLLKNKAFILLILDLFCLGWLFGLGLFVCLFEANICLA